MPEEYPFVPPQRHPNSLVLFVAFHGALTQRQRRAFFARLHHEARRLGVVLSHQLGWCVVYSAERLCASAHRRQMLYWLIDQPEVKTASASSLIHLRDLFSLHTRLRIVGDEGGFPKAEEQQALLLEAVFDVVGQWLAYLRAVV